MQQEMEKWIDGPIENIQNWGRVTTGSLSYTCT